MRAPLTRSLERLVDEHRVALRLGLGGVLVAHVADRALPAQASTGSTMQRTNAVGSVSEAAANTGSGPGSNHASSGP